MVFEDKRSNDTSRLPYMHSSSSSIDGLTTKPLPSFLTFSSKVLISLEDTNYKGLELHVFCEKHGKAAERLVAFEGVYTRRRFLACAEPANHTYHQQCRKAEMAKKDADTEKLNQKYELLCNLTSDQATVIQNLKFKNIKEKELLSEAKMNLELTNAEFTKFEEKLSQEKLELKF
ncbi:hypothetical protein ZWY2020_028498 [Hordeum vulgare]|nr:hypothetical protein ZWY2020_028498 [Hordeum vulgare]